MAEDFFAVSNEQVKEMLRIVLDYGGRHGMPPGAMPFFVESIGRILRDEYVSYMRSRGASDEEVAAYLDCSGAVVFRDPSGDDDLRHGAN